MRRLVVVLLLFIFQATPAHADWRWAKPHFKTKKVAVWCETQQCVHAAHIHARAQRRAKVDRYNHRRLKEWQHWTRQPIATCTWYGESGTGPQFSPARYYIYNSEGSGARGKYQMMPSTYSDNAKYFDWSPLDQEIAGHREYYRHGTGPWSNCRSTRSTSAAEVLL